MSPCYACGGRFFYRHYRTWTGDDLLPYYVGDSLRSVHPEHKGLWLWPGWPVLLAGAVCS